MYQTDDEEEKSNQYLVIHRRFSSLCIKLTIKTQNPVTLSCNPPGFSLIYQTDDGKQNPVNIL